MRLIFPLVIGTCMHEKQTKLLKLFLSLTCQIPNPMRTFFHFRRHDFQTVKSV